MTDSHVVPFLRTGMGRSPEDGGCIMQIVDWIHSGGWSDTPRCVNPVLRSFAIGVNDNVNDKERQKLLDLTPRLMGTRHKDEDRISWELARFALLGAPLQLAVADDKRNKYLVEQLENLEYRQTAIGEYVYGDGIFNGHTRLALRYFAAGNPVPGSENAGIICAQAGFGVEDLIELINEFDRLTNRDPVEAEIDFAPVCAILPEDHKRVLVGSGKEEK